MKHAIWFLPDELTPQIATLLFMGGGFALMLQQMRLAVSLLLLAVSVLVLPSLVDPLIGPVVDTAFESGRASFEAASLWVVAALVVVVPLLVLQALVALIFGRRAAAHVVGTLIAAGILLILRATFVLPLRLLGALARSLLR